MSAGRLAAIYRHPVKGFTPEAVDAVALTEGEGFPADRVYAIENGPSGFDPDAPEHVSKMKFTVLARSAVVAKLQTRFDEASGQFHITDETGEARAFSLRDAAGRDRLADYLASSFGEAFPGPLKVLEAPGAFRFSDHHLGHVSLLNLASVDAVSQAFGREVEASRFRMNLVFDGLSAWEEDEWAEGDILKLGEAELRVFKPTVRCKATHASPDGQGYDLDTVPLLHEHFGRNTLGLYAHVAKTGIVSVGDRLERA
ncbi:MOSC domain-containing protein [Ponticaulis sp.]|uniref:MOSC domain-containing protein n=1 Tax=Ponticaulis sp. TaxID=2020902 RepID=UPI000C4CF0B5|nr:MOSC domain-containing protein [Ponticaulis sp.]MAJ10061.1 MOSC domain-containing protein [Ponticaulis sp.]HBH88338.1 MOSC domain-containing protein [Hyphomonadaceae bacterium]HBJ94739.1 MOSC domain-containing protein [Hyphomonadaceae bacterium]|tara:strand:- start:33036 stop:33803 length:768 start_codon:yes stop_codon:yes gene_type:complete